MPPPSASDADLIAAVLRGEREAFRPLMERHQQAVFNYLFRRVGGNVEAARDLTQGVFLKAYQHLAEVDPSQGFTPWLYRIAHNESANHARSRARRREQGWAPEDLERLPDPMGSTPESRLAEQNEGQRIRQALDTLPARHIHVPVGDHGRKGGKHPDRKITGISGNSAH